MSTFIFVSVLVKFLSVELHLCPEMTSVYCIKVWFKDQQLNKIIEEPQMVRLTFLYVEL